MNYELTVLTEYRRQCAVTPWQAQQRLGVRGTLVPAARPMLRCAHEWEDAWLAVAADAASSRCMEVVHTVYVPRDRWPRMQISPLLGNRPPVHKLAGPVASRMRKHQRLSLIHISEPTRPY